MKKIKKQMWHQVLASHPENLTYSQVEMMWLKYEVNEKIIQYLKKKIQRLHNKNEIILEMIGYIESLKISPQDINESNIQ